MTQVPDDEFYVLYLSVPRTLRRFVRTFAALALVGLPAAGAALAWRQPDPGAGAWTDDQVEAVSGVLAASPYAVLFPSDGSAPVLVVESGKHGGRPRVDAFHARCVTLRGTMLRRDGHAMIELEETPDAITLLPGAASIPDVEPLHQGALAGEIVDAKCWHGAMKPGDGRTHKSCAALCIRGGIPPVLVIGSDPGPSSIALLTSPDGGPLDERALEYLAEPVQVQGELADWGGLTVIRARVSGIKRR